MRSAFFLTFLVLGSLIGVSAADIDSDDEWSDSGNISGLTTVKTGSTLTISGDYIVDDNASFVIEDGAELIISGNLSTIAPSKLVLAGWSNITIPVNNAGPTGTIRLNFHDEVIYPLTFTIENQTFENWTGDVFDWNGSLEQANIVISVFHLTFQVVAIDDIQVSPQGNTPFILQPEDLDGDGLSVVTEYDSQAWSIVNNGQLTINSAIVIGPNIDCSANCSIIDSTLEGTGPIDVTGALIISGSSLSGSLTDEDIIVWDDASITWINSNGTGDFIDNWINILTSRTVGVQSSNITFSPTDIGYDSIELGSLGDCSYVQQTTAECTDNIIIIGPTERSRLVRWQDGNGDLHTESASGVATISNTWGDYSITVESIPLTNHFDVEIDLPMIEVLSIVESDSNAVTNKRLGVMVSIENSGSASANIFLECTSGGEDVNIGLTVKTLIEAGETVEVPINWDEAYEGSKTLECGVYIPDSFEGINVGSGSFATSNTVVWADAEEDGANLTVPIFIGLAIGGILFFISSRNKAHKENDEVEVEVEDEDIGSIN
jgi:hypothetical protein